MKLRTKKLWKLRWKMIKEHTASWITLVLSIIISIVTYIKIAQYNVYPYYCNVTGYSCALFLNTLSIGYFSAFLFYVLHDFIPQSKKRLEDIQRAITLELSVYDCVETLDATLFKGHIIDMDNYCSVFVERTTEPLWASGKKRIKFRVPAEKYLRFLENNIEHCRSLLPFLDSSIIPVELYNCLVNLDLYNVIQKKNAVDDIKDNSFNEDSIVTNIRHYAESRDILKKHIDSLEPYSYITKKEFVPYD